MCIRDSSDTDHDSVTDHDSATDVVVSSTEITAEIESGRRGVYNVYVTTLNGTSKKSAGGTFTFS